MNPDAALPIGIEIGGHAIEAVISVGDTGFVYLASDPLLARQVAIKEYFPPALAVRHAGTQMRARSASDHRTVMAGRDAFIEESRLLARLDHPALVRVVGAYDLHQTAYRIMPLHAGPTLAQARAERGVPPGDDWLRRMIAELLGALEALHDAGIVHGHLHAGQVLLRSDDRPLLLGFGSAARVLGRRHEEGYAPPELSSVGHHLHRGPWTDLYSLAALSWFAVMGNAPPTTRPLDLRAAFDAAFGPAEQDAARLERDRLCAALTKALETSVAARPQSVVEIRSLLGGVPVEAAEPMQAELPPEPDPRVRAAIAAAVAGIPGTEPLNVPEALSTRKAPPRPEASIMAQVPSKPPVPAARPVQAAPPAQTLPPVHVSPSFQVPPVQARPTVQTSPPVQAPPPIQPRPSVMAVPPAQPAPRAPTMPTKPERAEDPHVEDPRVDAAVARAAAAAAAARTQARPPRDEGPDTIPAFLSMPSRTGKPARTMPFGLGPRVPPTGKAFNPEARVPVEPLLMPAAAPQTPPPAVDIDASVAPVWAGQHPETEAQPMEAASEGAVPPWMADRPADQDTMRRPAMQPRRSGWAWAAALVVGIAAGAVAWRWNELQDDRSARMAAAPAATDRAGDGARPPVQREDAAPPATAAVPPAAVPDPATAPPTAAGEAARPSPAPAQPLPAERQTAQPPVGAAPDTSGAVVAAAPILPTEGPGGDTAGAASPRRAESTVAEVPEPAARTPGAAPPKPARPEPRHAAAQPALPSPRAVCGDRTNFSLVYCMQLQCRKPSYSAHAQCREFRRTGEVG